MPLEGLRILLVTRDRRVHDTIRTLCSQITPTYRGLDWAGTYRAAVDALEDGAVDICILDDGLLNGAGLDLLREPSLQARHVPVIVLLEEPPPPEEDPLSLPGIADWIVKDALDLPSFQRAVRHASPGRDPDRSHSPSERRLEELLFRLSDSLGQARRLEDALRAALEEVVRHFSWDVGHAWAVSGGSARSLPLWVPEEAAGHAELRRVTESTRFRVGQGLVGQAMATGRPLWRSDVTADPDFVRKGPNGLGIRAGLALPVEAGGEVMAVLEFFSSEVRDPDPAVLEAAARVGDLLAPIADRERIVHVFRGSHELLSAAVDAMEDALFVKDEERRYVMMNRAAAALAGRSMGEALGRRDEEIFEPGAAETFGHLDDEVLESGEPISFVRGIRGDDGVDRTYRITKDVLRSPDGKILGIFGIARDVTERRRREARLRAEKEALEGRVLTLQALLGVGSALREPGLPLGERLERIAALVCEEGVLADRPAEARIVLHDKEFKTRGFDPSAEVHRVPILAGDGEVGVLEVTSVSEGAGADVASSHAAELLDRIAGELGTLAAAPDDPPN